MKKYSKVVNQETKECSVGLGSNIPYYLSIGMKLMDVEKAYNELWYLKGYAPEKPEEDIQSNNE